MIEKNIQPEVTQNLISELKEIYEDLDKFKSINSKNSLVVDLLSIPSILILSIKENNLDLYLKYLEYVESAFQIIPEDIFKILRSAVQSIKSIVKKYIMNSLLVNKNYLEMINNNYDFLNDVLDLNIDNSLYEITDDIDSTFLKKLNLIIYHLNIFEKNYLSENNKLTQVPFDFLKSKNENLIVIFKQYEDAYSSEKRNILLINILSKFLVR